MHRPVVSLFSPAGDHADTNLVSFIRAHHRRVGVSRPDVSTQGCVVVWLDVKGWVGAVGTRLIGIGQIAGTSACLHTIGAIVICAQWVTNAKRQGFVAVVYGKRSDVVSRNGFGHWCQRRFDHERQPRFGSPGRIDGLVIGGVGQCEILVLDHELAVAVGGISSEDVGMPTGWAAIEAAAHHFAGIRVAPGRAAGLYQQRCVQTGLLVG